MRLREKIYLLVEPRNKDSKASGTLTTVGYGDLNPISDTSRVISIISSMVGIAIIALPSGIVTAGYMDELRSRKEEQK